MAGKKKIEAVPKDAEVLYPESEADGSGTEAEALKTEIEEPIKEKVVYIGPSKIGLSPGAVFLDGISAQAEKLIAAVPVAKLLFVRLEDLSMARSQALKNGTALNTAFQKAMKADI